MDEAVKTTLAKEFSVIGIAARTSNAKEMSGTGIIGTQWNRFFTEGILDKIPNKADSNILAVYTDYESDRNGEYTFMLGAKVSDTSIIPSEMVLKKIPEGRYIVITSAEGPAGNVVIEAWQKIWSREDTSELAQAYQTDYEIYDERSRDPHNSQVDLYIGVK